jgi:hypothetical protein
MLGWRALEQGLGANPNVIFSKSGRKYVGLLRGYAADDCGKARDRGSLTLPIRAVRELRDTCARRRRRDGGRRRTGAGIAHARVSLAVRRTGARFSNTRA